MKRINLKHLRAFRAVAHHQHFTRAGEAIGLSQPALSSLIAQLEEDLSVQLFVRTTRNVELTAAGSDFLRSCTRILADVDTSIGEVRDFALLRRGRVRVAALPSLCTQLLPAVISSFHEQHPNIIVSVSDLPGDEITRQARERQIDFGIGYVTSADSLVSEPIFTDRLTALVQRNRWRGRTDFLQWQDLENVDIIAMSAGTTVRRMTDESANRADVSLRIMLEPNQMPTAIAYARAGLGVALLPSTGIPDRLDEELIGIPLSAVGTEREISIIRAAGSPLAPGPKAFAQMVRKAAGSLSNV